ncbi:hypothetical protein ACUXZJ_07220 [Flavobacterium sp. TN-1]
MKKIILTLSFILAVSCNKADFSKIKVGMATKEVVHLVGEPKEKQEIALLGASYWIYDTHIVAMVDNKVEGCLTKEEFGKQMINFTKETTKVLDTLDESLKALDSI